MELANAVQTAQAEVLHRVISENTQTEAVVPAEFQPEVVASTNSRLGASRPLETVDLESVDGEVIIENADLLRGREELGSQPIELPVSLSERSTVIDFQEHRPSVGSEKTGVIEIEDQNDSAEIEPTGSVPALLEGIEETDSVLPYIDEQTPKELLATFFEDIEDNATEHLPSFTNDQTELFIASMHLPETQTRQVAAVCAELPEVIQSRLSECVWGDKPEQKVAAETLVLTISLAADRLHELAETGAMDSEEATQITGLLLQWYEELGMLLEVDISEQDIEQFIARICSESFGEKAEAILSEIIQDEGTHEYKTDAFSIPQTITDIHQAIHYFLGQFALNTYNLGS
ncbi:MAG: hypothetical protein WA843_02335 [Candidatus Saccharimonadales bacterium]